MSEDIRIIEVCSLFLLKLYSNVGIHSYISTRTRLHLLVSQLVICAYIDGLYSSSMHLYDYLIDKTSKNTIFYGTNKKFKLSKYLSPFFASENYFTPNQGHL